MTDKQKVSNESPLCWVRPVTTVPDLGGFQVCREGEGFPVWSHPNGAYAPVSAEPVAWLIDWPDEPDLGHYLAEAPVDGARSRELVFRCTAPVAAQVQRDAVRNKYDWVQGPYVTDTMGSGWCVRIDGTDIFADLNQYGCKGRVTFQIARGLASKEEAETALDEWLSKYVTAQQPISGADGLTQKAWEEWKSRAAIAQRVASIPAVDKALEVFCNEGTADNAVALVRAVMTALAQLSGNPGQLDHLPDAAQMIEPSGNSGELPPLPKPDSYLFQHEETGLTECVDGQQVEWGFEKNNPRHQKIGGMFTEAQMKEYARAALAQQDAETGKSVLVGNQLVTQHDAEKVQADLLSSLVEIVDAVIASDEEGLIEHSEIIIKARAAIDAARKEQE